MADLYPVLVGGGLALAGATFGTILTFVNSHLERRQRRREILRQKYEEMVDYLDQTIGWFPTLDLCRSSESAVESHPPKAVRSLASLAMVYFPELSLPAKSYSSSVVDYYFWMVNEVPLNGTDMLGELASQFPEYQLRFALTVKTRHALEQAIEDHAKKYTRR